MLIQVFERRVLTYTPDNSDGWKVEAGNVGQHYYLCRYGRPVDLPESPAPLPSPTPTPSSTPSPSPCQFQVTYRVNRYSAKTVQVKYITAQGGSVQQDLPYVDSNIGRDWQKPDTFQAGGSTQVSAYLQPYRVYDEATQTWRTQPGTGA